MPFVARCPMCRQKMRFADDALGASQACPRCHNYFTVAADEHAARASAPAIAAEAVELPSAPRPPAVLDILPPAGPSRVHPSPRRPRKVSLWSVLSLLGGSVGFFCASLSAIDFLTLPLAALGLATGALGLAIERQRGGRLLAALGGVGSLVVLVLAFAWPAALSPSYAWRRAARPPDPKQFAVIPARSDQRPEPARPAEDDGVDIDEGGIRQGDVQVRVLRAFWGRYSTAAKGKNLTIVVRVSNVGTSGKVHYDSWGTAAHVPQLHDDRGQTYSRHGPGSSSTVSKHYANDELPAGTAVEDRLMFPEPAVGAAAFTLELPSAAVGGEGAFKFRISRSKILVREPMLGRKP